jgi:hypothetical protein
MAPGLFYRYLFAADMDLLQVVQEEGYLYIKGVKALGLKKAIKTLEAVKRLHDLHDCTIIKFPF